MSTPAMIVHGGAGTVPRGSGSESERACAAALALGWGILAHGGSAVDAVVRAVVHMEDEPSLNAGYGACLTRSGTVELDASIMEGKERAAGAVAAVGRLGNPILLARALMESGPHVLMVGSGAERLAAARGMSLIDPTTLITEERRASWVAARSSAAGSRLAERGLKAPSGTVGAVARDRNGHLAAATSTGGIPMQEPGRVGDSAIIGAGTFADDRAGAVSATGHGESIIRATLARSVVDLLRQGLDPRRAATLALADVTAIGGTAGVIVIDSVGRVGAAHTTPYMTWFAKESGP